MRPSETFALRVLREEDEASRRDYLLAMLCFRSKRWRRSTYATALQRLVLRGLAVRWQAGACAFYKPSPAGKAVIL